MKVNVEGLQKKLIDDPDLIIKVLTHLGIPEETIRHKPKSNLITSVRPEEGADNRNGLLLYTNSLRYMYTTRNGSGNIFTLVMDVKKVSFPSCLRLISKWAGVGEEELEAVETIVPFGGFYKKLSSLDDDGDLDIPTYDEEEYFEEERGLSKLFFDDHISYEAQQVFGDAFDHDNNAILIPIRDMNGNLVGIKARTNEKKPLFGLRYWAKLPFSKTCVVYGLDINYRSIIQKNTVVVVEAEKSVQQAWTFGCKIAVSTMGCTISRVQARILKSLMVKKIIIAFDEGLSEREIREQARMLVINEGMLKNEVFYIYGGMREGSKDSPTDQGRETFRRLLRENLVKVSV